ncbi:unnamed protein product [Gadus morhua 'NCC']
MIVLEAEGAGGRRPKPAVSETGFQFHLRRCDGFPSCGALVPVVGRSPVPCYPVPWYGALDGDPSRPFPKGPDRDHHARPDGDERRAAYRPRSRGNQADVFRAGLASECVSLYPGRSALVMPRGLGFCSRLRLDPPHREDVIGQRESRDCGRRISHQRTCQEASSIKAPPPRPRLSGPASLAPPPRPTSLATPPRPRLPGPASLAPPLWPRLPGPTSLATPPRPRLPGPASLAPPPRPRLSGHASQAATSQGPSANHSEPRRAEENGFCLHRDPPCTAQLLETPTRTRVLPERARRSYRHQRRVVYGQRVEEWTEEEYGSWPVII